MQNSIKTNRIFDISINSSRVPLYLWHVIKIMSVYAYFNHVRPGLSIDNPSVQKYGYFNKKNYIHKSYFAGKSFNCVLSEYFPSYNDVVLELTRCIPD